MNRFDNLPDWLAWLETLHPKAIDMGLERVREVAQRLGVLQPGIPVVTVAGTNGKGSTTAALEALLKEHGKRVGCYTSPHILRFGERIRIDGNEVSDADIVAALVRVDEARGDVSLTYFEFTTLAAFVLFTQARLDAWVLEIGLGGRLDAVNVIDSDIAVITSIGLDHQEWLGHTRDAIAREKVGIARAQRPLVIGDPDPPPALAGAVEVASAQPFYVGKAFRYRRDAAHQWAWQGQTADGSRCELSALPMPSLALANVATALQAFLLLPFAVDVSAVRMALCAVQLPGRNQRIDLHGRAVILDVGHNPDGMRFLLAELQRHALGERFHVVLGMLADKDIVGAVRVLEPLALSWHIAPLPSQRSATAAQLRDAIVAVTGANSPVSMHATLGNALLAVLSGTDTLPVLVTGSFYTVSEAMTVLAQEAAR